MLFSIVFGYSIDFTCPWRGTELFNRMEIRLDSQMFASVYLRSQQIDCLLSFGVLACHDILGIELLGDFLTGHMCYILICYMSMTCEHECHITDCRVSLDHCWQTNAPFACRSDGTRMHCGKKTCQWREWDALGNFPLGNYGSGHSCGFQFDTCHLPKHHYRPGTCQDLQTRTFMSMVLPNGSGLIQMDNVHCHTAHTVWE